MSISDLYALKSKYTALKSNVLNIIEVTKNTINNLERPSEDTKKYFTKNEVSVDGNIIKNVRDELVAKNNHLTNVVVKNIDEKINSISSEITALEELERKQKETAQASKKYSSHISSTSSTSKASAPVAQPQKPRIQKSIRVSTN